ncbi:MAG TPA: hypothetical protein VGX76_15820 [Pirellulales bacterium]|nr:hypothetical protein [Pirellulales bacterium]
MCPRKSYGGLHTSGERRHASHAKTRRRAARLQLERLEDRLVLSTDTWSSPRSGSWSTAGNWSTGAVPQPNDDVVISGAANLMVTLNGSTTVNSLTLTEGTLKVASGTLGVAANSSLGAKGTVMLGNGNLAVASGATLTNSGTIESSMGNVASALMIDGTLSNTGVIEATAGTLAIDAAGSIAQVSGDALTAGAWKALKGATLTIAPNQLANAGFEQPAVATSGTTAPSGWNTWGSTFVSKQFAYTGRQSIQESGANSGVDQSFAVTGGMSYTASVYAMTPSSDRLSGSEVSSLGLIFFDAQGNQITPDAPPNDVPLLTSTSATGGPLAGTAGGQGWNYYTLTAVAPANAATVDVDLGTGAFNGSGSGGGSTYWDDARFGPTSAFATNQATLLLGGSGADITGLDNLSANSGSMTIQPGAILNLSGAFTQASGGNLTLSPGKLATGVGTNLLTNAGFESAPVVPSGWSDWGTADLSTQYAQSGGQSLQAYGPNSGVLQSFSVTPGVSYTGTVDAMTPASNPLSGPEGAFIEIIFFDAGGNQISPYAPPNSLTVLTSQSAAGGPISGSVGNQGWNSFSITDAAPSNAATADFILETGAYTGLAGTAGGAVYWDDAVFGTTAGANLLTNSGFESPTAGTISPSGWSTWGNLQLSTQYAQGGAQSVQASGPNTGVLQSFPARPGVSYTGTVDAMTPASNPLTGPEGAFLEVIFFDVNGSQISSYAPPNSVTILTSQSAPGGPISGSFGDQGWNSFSTTAVAPANAATVEFIVETGAYTGLAGTAGGVVYWDNAAFGPTAVSGASFSATSLSNSGTITVDAGGVVQVGGAFTQTTTGTVAFQLAGPSVSGLYGSLTAGGSATLAGKLKASLANGYSPLIDDGFTLLSYAGVKGNFGSSLLPSSSKYRFLPAVNPTYTAIGAVPASLSATVNAASAVNTVSTNLLGVNLTWWDDKLTTSQTQQMVGAAGLAAFRFPGGSSSDDFHFNVASSYGDPVAVTIPQFAQFIQTAGGTGLVTLDYGSGSPQEAAAELAYLEGSPTDGTVIGNGLEWSDGANAWQTVDWKTVGYWASLRAAQPLGVDDGLNFLRINQSTPFANINLWEVGNEEYGNWEIDHHGTSGPGGASTGAQHDPATYAAFAEAFAGYAAEIDPNILIGIDSGDPNSGWTDNVLKQGLALGFVPGFISDHSYMQGPGSENDTFLLRDTVSNPGSVLDWATRYADYQTLLTNDLGSQAGNVRVMATEFNSVYANPGKQSTSLVNGLFIADSIGSLLGSGYTGGFVWDLRNGWSTYGGNDSASLYGWRQGGDYGLLGDPNLNSPPSTGAYVAYPSYFAEQLASKIVQAGGTVVSASSNYAGLVVYAVKEPNGHLDLLVINKDHDAAISEPFTIQGFTPSTKAQAWQYAEAQDYSQSQSTTGAAALANFAVTLKLKGSNFSYTFPAYSMTVIDLSPAGSSTAAAMFAVPGANRSDASGATHLAASHTAALGRRIVTRISPSEHAAVGEALTRLFTDADHPAPSPGPLVVEFIPDREPVGFAARQPDASAYGERETIEEASADFR